MHAGARAASVKGFTRLLRRDKYLRTDPGATVELPRVDQTLPRTILSETEMTTLLLAPDVTDVLGLRDRAMLEVFYSTGMRNTELCLLQLTDVRLTEGEVGVRRGKEYYASCTSFR
jgi:integrase/recombinase XerD